MVPAGEYYIIMLLCPYNPNRITVGFIYKENDFIFLPPSLTVKYHFA
jgi:hypothetical protein